MKALNALAPFTAQLLDEIAHEHDYVGEQFAPRVLPAAVQVFSWKPVAVEMPDDCIAVLTFSPDRSEPVWLGFHEDGQWFDCAGNKVHATITHWAHLPEPPTSNAR